MQKTLFTGAGHSGFSRMANHNAWRLLEKQFSELSIVPFPHVLMKWPREHPLPDVTSEYQRHRLYERYSHRGWPLVGRDPWMPAGPMVLCEWWSAGHDVGLPSDRQVWASTQEKLRRLIVLMDEAAFTIIPEQLQIAREIPDPVTRWAVALHELVQPAPQQTVLKAEQWPHVQPPVERYAIPPHCEGDATLALDYTQRAFISKSLRSLVLSDYLPFGLAGVLVDAPPSRHPNVEYSIIHSLPLACAKACSLLALAAGPEAAPLPDPQTPITVPPSPENTPDAGDRVAAATAESDQTEGLQVPNSSKCSFSKTGDFWEIWFLGDKTTVRQSVGLSYLVQLIERQGTPIQPTDLWSNRTSKPVTFTGSSGETITQEGFKNLRLDKEELLQDLERAKANGDQAEQERIEGELAAISEYVRKATGIGGRTRKINDLDKLANSVNQEIRRAIEKLEKKLPSLWRHLEAFVTQGSTCIYDPHPPVDWEIAHSA